MKERSANDDKQNVTPLAQFHIHLHQQEVTFCISSPATNVDGNYWKTISNVIKHIILMIEMICTLKMHLKHAAKIFRCYNSSIFLNICML